MNDNIIQSYSHLWAVLNPDGFKYTGRELFNKFPDPSHEFRPAFARLYGCVSMSEDMATVAEALLSGSDIEEYADKHKDHLLQSKIIQIKKIYEYMSDGKMNANYWYNVIHNPGRFIDGAYWEQHSQTSLLGRLALRERNIQKKRGTNR